MYGHLKYELSFVQSWVDYHCALEMSMAAMFPHLQAYTWAWGTNSCSLAVDVDSFNCNSSFQPREPIFPYITHGIHFLLYED